jgi:hypothetical protein
MSGPADLFEFGQNLLPCQGGKNIPVHIGRKPPARSAGKSSNYQSDPWARLLCIFIHLSTSAWSLCHNLIFVRIIPSCPGPNCGRRVILLTSSLFVLAPFGGFLSKRKWGFQPGTIRKVRRIVNFGGLKFVFGKFPPPYNFGKHLKLCPVSSVGCWGFLEEEPVYAN